VSLEHDDFSIESLGKNNFDANFLRANANLEAAVLIWNTFVVWHLRGKSIPYLFLN
jgi:hypothetical protein